MARRSSLIGHRDRFRFLIAHRRAKNLSQFDCPQLWNSGSCKCSRPLLGSNGSLRHENITTGGREQVCSAQMPKEVGHSNPTALCACAKAFNRRWMLPTLSRLTLRDVGHRLRRSRKGALGVESPSSPNGTRGGCSGSVCLVLHLILAVTVLAGLPSKLITMLTRPRPASDFGSGPRLITSSP